MITMNSKFYIEKFSRTINYLSGGLDRNPTFLRARQSYVLYINLLMARALDVPCFNPLEARVSYVSSCTILTL